MKRRDYLIGVGIIAGGGRILYDEFWPDHPTPDNDDVTILDLGFSVETPPETDEAGSGYAYTQIENNVDYPLRATVTFELLQDDNPYYSYDYEHNEVLAYIDPGEDRILAETWSVDEFPKSIDATDVEISTLEVVHADEGAFFRDPPEEGEKE